LLQLSEDARFHDDAFRTEKMGRRELSNLVGSSSLSHLHGTM
jgi:hypothetical protein